MNIVEFLEARIAEDQAAAKACNPSPWFFNGYSAVMSQPMLHDHDQWEDEAFKAGHSLEKRGDCPACGKTTCDLYTEDYHRDPLIVGVAAHHGDTSIGKRVADAQHIERHDPARILAECAAKRAIIDHVSKWGHEYNDDDTWYSCGLATGFYDDEPGGGCADDSKHGRCTCGLAGRQAKILSPLAAVYSDHPEYRQEWSPRG